MPAFAHLFQSRHFDCTEQIRDLQHAIQEHMCALAEVKQRRLRIEEERIQCERETERRVNLIMEKAVVVDVLVQLGHLLQEEKHLTEQLNGPDAVERKQRNDLQERSERLRNIATSLAAEILEVKERLAEIKARNAAAQLLIQAQTIKSKRRRRKPN